MPRTPPTTSDQLAAHIDSFCDGLRAAGYGPAAVTSRRLIINAFIRSIASRRRAAEDLSDADVTAFLKRRPTRREDPKERAILRRLIGASPCTGRVFANGIEIRHACR